MGVISTTDKVIISDRLYQVIFNLMVLQQGCIPATRKDDENKSWWYLGF